MTIVTIHVAKTTLSNLIERAQLGEEIVIARGKEPVVRLVPIETIPQRQFGMYKGLAKIGPEFFDPLPDDELDAWEER